MSAVGRHTIATASFGRGSSRGSAPNKTETAGLLFATPMMNSPTKFSGFGYEEGSSRGAKLNSTRKTLAHEFTARASPRGGVVRVHAQFSQELAGLRESAAFLHFAPCRLGCARCIGSGCNPASQSPSRGGHLCGANFWGCPPDDVSTSRAPENLVSLLG
jgi:hypothetical protein